MYNKAPPTSSQHGEVSHTVDLVSQAIKESGVLPDSTSSPGNRRISLEEGHSLLDISQLFNNERNASLETADVVARDDRCGVVMRTSSTIDSSSPDLSINRFLHGLNNQSLLDVVNDVGFPEAPSNGGESSNIDQPEVVGTSSAPDGFRKDCDKITGLENTSIDEQNDSNMFDMINQILGDPVNESNNSSESPVGGQLLNTSEGVLTTPDCAKNVPNNSDENKGTIGAQGNEHTLKMSSPSSGKLISVEAFAGTKVVASSVEVNCGTDVALASELAFTRSFAITLFVAES